jgi:hypothetical protein
MDDDYAQTEGQTDAVRSFSRPRYFYGQLLDVRHFESEQAYFKRKQWMLNRLISGFGVVCGLDVQVGDDEHSVVVLPGVALDRRGREIVVPSRSKKVAIEPKPAEPDGGNNNGGATGARGNVKRHDDGSCDDDWVHLVICYDECKTDPEPVLSGGCEGPERCAPGAIREGYELRLEPGRAPDISVDSSIPNLIKGNNVDYRALVRWVSDPCGGGGGRGGPCITLANIRLPSGEGTVELSHIDISVRPIVYSLDLLWELVLSLSHETQNRRSGKH